MEEVDAFIGTAFDVLSRDELLLIIRQMDYQSIKNFCEIYDDFCDIYYEQIEIILKDIITKNKDEIIDGLIEKLDRSYEVTNIIGWAYVWNKTTIYDLLFSGDEHSFGLLYNPLPTNAAYLKLKNIFYAYYPDGTEEPRQTADTAIDYLGLNEHSIFILEHRKDGTLHLGTNYNHNNRKKYKKVGKITKDNVRNFEELFREFLDNNMFDDEMLAEELQIKYNVVWGGDGVEYFTDGKLDINLFIEDRIEDEREYFGNEATDEFIKTIENEPEIINLSKLEIDFLMLLYKSVLDGTNSIMDPFTKEAIVL